MLPFDLADRFARVPTSPKVTGFEMHAAINGHSTGVELDR
jgi:hypothetical protein